MSEDKFSEADLCKEFRVFLEVRGFDVWPEVEDWDLLAVFNAKAPCDGSPAAPRLQPADQMLMLYNEPGTQLGIQAKLQCNVDVLYQAALKRFRSGPRIRLVLVRRATPEFLAVAAALGLAVAVRERKVKHRYTWTKNWSWEPYPGGFTIQPTSKIFFGKQCVLPSIITDLPAGVKAPKQLTPWREKALKLCRVGREKGFLTSADFKEHNVSMTRWTREGWVRNTGEKTGVLNKYVLTSDAPDIGWEQISEQLHNTLDERTAV